MRKELLAQLWARDIKKNRNIDVFESTRRREVVTYRALHVYMLRNNLEWSLMKIRHFYEDNGKSYDHATALHALKMFEIYCKYDSDLLTEMDTITSSTKNDVIEYGVLKSKLKYIHPSLYKELNELLQPFIERTVKKNKYQLHQDNDKGKEKAYVL